MAENQLEGFAISCDLEGNIQELLYNNIKSDCILSGSPFYNFVDIGSREKAFNFIRKIREESMVHDWELTISCKQKLVVMHVSGILDDENILVFGAKSVTEMIKLIESFTSKINKNTAALQHANKNLHILLKESPLIGEDVLYEELGRLNNELTNAQRELTKKNIQLTELNQQKEMLLKEIHHRVKNNLMIISSLLELQSQYLKDKESIEIFKESQNRAKSMALIHERLYKSTDLKNINFKEYITTLANDLYLTYVNDPNQVSLKLKIEDIKIDINAAIPLGLILNELITNSMKYAFPDNLKGTVYVSFSKEGDEFILKVGDDGVGFPQGIDYKNTDSLGLQLVNSLTSQIDGEIELKKTPGTEFVIKFKDLGLIN